jgi:hypothetical protein
LQICKKKIESSKKYEGIQQTLQPEPQRGNSDEEPLMKGKYTDVRC